MSESVLEILAEGESTSRGFRRFALSFKVGVRLSADLSAGATPATAVNASISGLCFSSPVEFPVGTLIEVEVELDHHGYKVPAVVRRCLPTKRLGRVFYECGIQYLKSDATLRFLPVMAKHLLPRALET